MCACVCIGSERGFCLVLWLANGEKNGKGVYQENYGPTIIDPVNTRQAEKTEKPTHAETSYFSSRAFQSRGLIQQIVQ